ncbi:MAG: tetratricopeptide repeat protein [Gammaproteobacteria bacterium]|nr:tetratricopeptide repeat protein [Gammaproteobacteria bacterium]MDH3431898.1 tetratricopeptide repeat protein [Gammaproteobacteria bacterium]
MSLVAELRRRNVFRVAAAYLVVGWLLTEVLTTILPTLGAPEWTARAVILVFAFGFIPAVVFSWFYELTPEGIKREYEVQRDESVTAGTAKKLDYVTVAAVVIGIFFIAFFSAQTSDDDAPPAAVSNASVAVLPFVNMSDNAENEYFSDGLTETLLHMLAQIPELKVAARTSSFAFKGQNRTVIEIAQLLGVAHILEGSVQRSGDRVRITAQLIRADDGFHVWSETFDRTFDDIFGIQDEIAEKVGSALSVSLLGTTTDSLIAGVTTESSDAYDLYLMALKERSTFSYGGLRAAEDLLKGALTIDPDFLDAKVELAIVYAHQVETGLMDQHDAYTQIMAITSQVLEARPNDVDARAMRLFTEKAYLAEQADPEEMFDLVEQLEDIVAEYPAKYQPRVLLSRALQGLQRLDRSLEIQQEALERDPFNPRILYEIGSIYAALGQVEEAQESLNRSLEIEPLQPNAYAILAGLSLQVGDGVDYLQQFLKAIEVDPKDHELAGMVANFLYNLKLIEEGDDFRDRVMAIAPTSEIAYQVELSRAINAGDTEAGLASARRAIEDDIDDRRFSYGGAVEYLLRDAARRGTVEEEASYIEQHAPGIFDIEASAPPGKYRAAQMAAFDAWYVSLSHDELLNRLEQFGKIAAAYGFDPQENPRLLFRVLALQGDVEGAIKVALENFADDSPLQYAGWRETLAQAQYQEIVADPRVRAVLRSWEEQEAEIRDEVRTYLADLYAAT